MAEYKDIFGIGEEPVKKDESAQDMTPDALSLFGVVLRKRTRRNRR